MTPELTILTLAALLQMLQMGLFSVLAQKQVGPRYAASPRDEGRSLTGRAGRAEYEARGWTVWRGPTRVLGPRGVEPTPDEDGAVLVLGGTGLDLDAPITCDWRDGDVW